MAGGGVAGQQFTLGDGQTALRVGVGEGEFKLIGTLEAKPGAKTSIAGRSYEIRDGQPDYPRVWFDNDPAADVMFKEIRANGQPSGFMGTQQLWPAESETQKRGEAFVHGYFEPSSRIGIFTRKRVWHTFEGFAPRPASPAPSDSEVMASFSRPLDLPEQGGSAVDRLAAAKAKVIAADFSAGGVTMKYVADATGKRRMASKEGTLVCDGERCLFDVSGTMFVSRYGLPSERFLPTSQGRILDSLTSIESTLSGVKLIGEESLAGVPVKVFEGWSTDEKTRTSGQLVRLWRDAQGRLLQMKIGNLGSIALRYDSPEDARLLVIPEADLARAQDADRALPVLDKLTARPAVFERRAGDRVVKIHEVLAGENGDIYVGYSVQLTPEAAKVLRFASEGESWGRGFMELSSDPQMRQYNAAYLAFIHERDRSLWWVALTPAAVESQEPWMIRLCMLPAGSPNGTDLLRRQGLGGFGVMQFALPPTVPTRKSTLDSWLTQVHAQVSEYSKAATLKSYVNVQPITENLEEFVKSAKATVESARRGAPQALTAD